MGNWLVVLMNDFMLQWMIWERLTVLPLYVLTVCVREHNEYCSARSL